jgi:hypothetical protein
MFKATISKIITRMIIPLSLILILTAVLACAPEVETPPEPLPNISPVIHYIEAPAETLPQTVSDVSCVATDSDSDNLTYEWSCNGGTLIGIGDKIAWNSPEQAGSYDVSVVVTDGRGGRAEDYTTIVVNAKPNAAPVISRITVTKEDNTQITVDPGTTESVLLALWKTATITCTVDDPDGDKVDLIWSASDGKIEGEGNTVNYIATERGDFVVIVNAIDSNGASTKGVVYFHVPCCGEGSFGQKGT